MLPLAEEVGVLLCEALAGTLPLTAAEPLTGAEGGKEELVMASGERVGSAEPSPVTEALPLAVVKGVASRGRKNKTRKRGR